MMFLYRTLGVSKQAVSQHHDRAQHLIDETNRLIEHVDSIRRDHPRMGVRKMYGLIKSTSEGALSMVGRDKFESLMLRQGYGTKPIRNRMKTTQRHASAKYTNLISGMTLTGINQVWVSDITYVWTPRRWYYLTLVEDVYSRRILGYYPSTSLDAEGMISALALAVRGIMRYDHLIHHSDRGGQYIDSEFVSLLDAYGIDISMCDSPQENAYVERLHGTIKNEYLVCYVLDSDADVWSAVSRSIELYNTQRPHSSLLHQMSPVQFENYIVSLSDQEKPTVKIYTDGGSEEYA